MKKILVIGAVVIVVILVVGVAGIAYAQTQTPNFHMGFGMMGGQNTSGQAGYGMMGGRLAATPGSRTNNSYGAGMMAGRGSYGMMGGAGYGLMHQAMVDALAKELGLTSADVQAALQTGKTPYQLAQEKGLTTAQISELMQKVHDEALAQAVASGLLTQQQAEWMDQHMEQMWSNGFGPGMMGGRGGFGTGGGCPAFGAQATPGSTN